MRADPHGFIDSFYMRLFTAHPDIRELFPASLERQRAAFAHVLDHVLSRLSDSSSPSDLVEFLAQLGRDHRKYGLLEEHYTWAYEALLAQARETFGEDWDADTQGASAHAFLLATGVMRGAAESVTGPRWWEARVVEKIRATRELAIVRLVTKEKLTYRAGQYLEVSIPQWPQVWRVYSPSLPPNPDGQIEFYVRTVDAGPVSSSILLETAPGDVWRLAQAHGTMHVDGRYPVVMIAGGCGLAPLRAIVLEMARRADSPPTTLFYATRYPGEMFELANLHALAAANPWLRLIAVTEEKENPWWLDVAQSPSDVGVEWLIGNAASAVIESGVVAANFYTDQQVLIAGSREMINYTRQQLVIAGVAARNIQHDPT